MGDWSEWKRVSRGFKEGEESGGKITKGAVGALGRWSGRLLASL